jgi:MFS family permease
MPLSPTQYSASNTSRFRKGLVIWGTAAFFYFFQFILRVSPSACADSIMASLTIDAATLGGVIGFYYTGYTLMQIPAGIVLDRIGVRLPVVVGMVLCSLGVFVFAFAKSLVVLSIARFMMGFGSAFALLSNIKLVSVWFKPRIMSVFIGLTLLAGTIGAVVGGAPLTLLFDHVGWKTTLVFLAGCGFIHAMLAWFTLADAEQPELVGEKTTIEQQDHYTGICTAFSQTLKSPFTYFIGLYGMLMYLPLSGFCDLWGASFIEDVYQVSRLQATSIASCVYIGMGVGSPLWPLLHTRLNKYGLEMALSAFLTCLCFVCAFYIILPSLMILKICLFAGGVALSGQFLCFAAVTQFNCRSRTGIATGIHNMMCMMSGVIAQPLIGFFMDLYGRVEGVEGIVFTHSAYIAGFSVITGGLSLALLMIYFSRRELKKLSGLAEA